MPIARVQEMLASSVGREVNRAVAPLVQGNRHRATRHHLECLWQVLRDDCSCGPQDCSLKDGGTVENMECQAGRAQCRICAFLRCHSTVREDALAIATDKNRRLAILLDLAPLVAGLFPRESAATGAAEKTKVLVSSLCQLLSCKESRLGCIRQLGNLVTLAPRLQSAQLESGWGDFWDQMRKIAKAVNRQASHECQLVALLAVRLVLGPRLPQDSTWPYYLCSAGTPSEEQALMDKYFDTQ